MACAQLATSQTTFEEEPWAKFWPDGQDLFPLHWKELALNQDKIKMDVDAPRYEQMEQLGMLNILTARKEGKLTGYIMSFIMPHFHYKSAGNMCLIDMFWTKPEARHGTGVRLFIEWEKRMKARGVINLITSCKVHQDHQKLFERLGYKWTDKTFMKVLL
jgi:hypothetical protein